MTKSREIELLDATIKTFGENSYLGPWLRENRDSIVADIQNDCSVDLMLPGHAYRQGRADRDATTEACKQLVVDAKAQAFRIEDEARDAVIRYREQAARLLEQQASDVRTGRQFNYR